MKLVSKTSKRKNANNKTTQESVRYEGVQSLIDIPLESDEAPEQPIDFVLPGIEIQLVSTQQPDAEFLPDIGLQQDSSQHPEPQQPEPQLTTEPQPTTEPHPTAEPEQPTVEPQPTIFLPDIGLQQESTLKPEFSPQPTEEPQQTEEPQPTIFLPDVGLQQESTLQPEPTTQPTAEQQPEKPPKKQKKNEKHVYPNTTLSDKQLEALQKVIGPGTEPKSKRKGRQDTGKKGTKGSRKRKEEIDNFGIDDRSTYSLVRTVFLVIFIVLFASAAGFSGWYYWWTTHATFEHELQPIVVLEGQHFDPNAFLYPGEEERGLSVVFQDPGFEPAVGLQYVPLTVKLGWRSVENAAALYVLEPIEYYQHEFKAEGAVLRPVEFLSNPETARGVPFEIRFAEAPLPLDSYEVGEYKLLLALNDIPFEVTLTVVDTTAPTATGVAQEIRIGDEVFAEYFVTDIHDYSPIHSITFAEEPNVHSRETQTVKIAIEDIFGNVGTVTAELTILLNQMPPVIDIPTFMIESEVGATIDYLQGVTALDDFGRPLEVHVDDGAVNVDEEGVYIAIFWAEDLSGNRMEEDVTVYIIAVSPETVYAMVNEILDRIVNDSMTDVQKVRHINDWIRWSTRGATTESEVTSTLGGAYIALRDRQGDYNIISALAQVMLTEAGVENMFITRHPDAETSHRWNLINPDSKGWHHFDGYPTGLGLGNGQMSMFTDERAQDFANRIKMEDYYKYDKDQYPEVVQK